MMNFTIKDKHQNPKGYNIYQDKRLVNQKDFQRNKV